MKNHTDLEQSKDSRTLDNAIQHCQKIAENCDNKYKIAPNMYCNENTLNDYFNEFKKTLGIKKKYRFDNIRHDVMNWSAEVRKTMTKQMIYMLPDGLFYWSDLIKGLIIRDYFGEVIDDYEDWKKQREEYIDNLYRELKNGEE